MRSAGGLLAPVWWKRGLAQRTGTAFGRPPTNSHARSSWSTTARRRSASPRKITRTERVRDCLRQKVAPEAQEVADPISGEAESAALLEARHHGIQMHGEPMLAAPELDGVSQGPVVDAHQERIDDLSQLSATFGRQA